MAIPVSRTTWRLLNASSIVVNVITENEVDRTTKRELQEKYCVEASRSGTE